MRLVVGSCLAMFFLGACAVEAPPPVTPATAVPVGQWAAPAPTMGNDATAAPLFGFPAIVPAWPLPTVWPGQLPVPAGLPVIPGLPAMWPQGAPPPLAPGQPGPAQPAPPGARPATSSDVAQRCVDDINGYRASKGLTPLARWTAGEPCATQEAADDSRAQRPHGSFGACKESSQNACPNWSGPAERMTDDCLRMMWNEGPGDFPAHGHYSNMVDTRVSKVACGTFTMSDGRLWAVQDFQ